MFRLSVSLLLALACVSSTSAQGLKVEDSGGAPENRVIVVTSPGVYELSVTQGSGGGITKFYNLAVDPEKKTNLPWDNRGLLEIGWHGASYKDPAAKDCCAKHILEGKKEGEACYSGCGDWPSAAHRDYFLKNRNRPGAPDPLGTLEIVEQSPARVRIRAEAPFMWWGKYVHTQLIASATYAFYPSGTIVAQVRVRNTGEPKLAFHWSTEYGPHLALSANGKNPDTDLGFAWSTPKQDDYKSAQPVEELMFARSDKTKTAFLLAIPPEEEKTFDRFMRHNGRGIGWDRAGYGSKSIVMEPGYDDTWACFIQMCSPADRGVPSAMTAKDALPFAMQYRAPAKIEGAELVKDDAGDFNSDGFNESEGCHVLKGSGPLSFTYEKGEGAGFAPAFKVAGWKADAPKSVKVDGKDVPCAAGVVDGNLVLQVLGTIEPAKAKIEIGG